MGQRGPAPKRSDQRIRRNAPAIPIEKVEGIGAVFVPESLLGVVDPHPLTQYWFEAFKSSAQNRFYEQTDWALVLTSLEMYDNEIKSGKRRATVLAQIQAMWSDLLVSEADRRRVSLEVEREQSGGDVLNVADLFRARLAEG